MHRVALLTHIEHLEHLNIWTLALNIGNTPLHFVYWFGRASLVQALLEARSDPTALNRVLLTPVELARSRGFGEMAELFTT